jgi:exopolysaccharide biosynthesis polyprenyl glycosylphosphotransferase
VMRRANRGRERVLFIGREPITERILIEIGTRSRNSPIVVGVLDDGATDGCASGCPVLGPVSRLAEVVETTAPHRVVVALGERRRRTPIRALVESCVARGIVVEDAAEFYERLTGKLAIESLTPRSIVFSRRFGPSGFDQACARVLSLIVAVAGLVLLLPLLLLIAIAVKLESPGPVLFVQPRIGAGGRSFRLMKFRTMRAAGSARSEWECDNRDRVTRLGRWLRAFRLDELPQFVNVLRGEMNLVGPRPHPVTNFELFTLVSRNLNELTGSAVSYYSLRTMVRPGVTGWAQVRYRYANNIEEEIEKLRYDIYYVKYASIALDLRVLARTLRVVLLGQRSHASAEPAPAASTVAAGSLGLPPDATRAQAA